jgi:hypothetical protein
MTTEIYHYHDGKSYQGRLHPEIAEDALRILKKDLAKIKKYKCKSFVRRPYRDLNEIQMLKAYPNAPDNIEAVIVISIIKGDTNARIPIGEQEIVEALRRNHLDLYTKPESKGFA